MAKLGISTGTVPNDNTGDSLIIGAVKINNNFNEIYTYLGAGSTTVLSAPIWSTTNAGINTLRNVGVGTTNPTSTLTVSGDAIVTGIITASTFSGTISNSNYSNISGISTYSLISGVSTSSSKVSIAETNSGNNSVLLSSGATLGDNALYIDSGLTYNAATNTLSTGNFVGNLVGNVVGNLVGNVSYASSSGVSTYSDVSGISTYSITSGESTYSNVSGISSISEGLTGAPNITVGIITATGGFISSGGLPVQIDVVGSTLIFNVVGIGSTSLTLSWMFHK